MSTLSETELQKLKFNRLTTTQIENATTLVNTEFYLEDKQFTGGKLLQTTTDGDVIEKPTVTDTTSTSITLANAEAGTTYKYGTLTNLTITANDISDNEIIIFFTADATGISVSLPDTMEYIGSAPVFEAGKKYAVSILNNVLVAGGIA